MLRLAVLLVFLPAAAWAQQAQPDPRLSGPMIQALQSQLALQSAMMKANEEDLRAENQRLEGALAEAETGPLYWRRLLRRLDRAEK